MGEGHLLAKFAPGSEDGYLDRGRHRSVQCWLGEGLSSTLESKTSECVPGSGWFKLPIQSYVYHRTSPDVLCTFLRCSLGWRHDDPRYIKLEPR